MVHSNRKVHKRKHLGLCALLSLLIAWALIFCASVHLPRIGSDLSTGSVFQGILADFKLEATPPLPSSLNNNRQLHMIFSTGCSPQQHWESYVFFFHAFKVKQPGNVTRLVSGCGEQEAKALRYFHRTKIVPMSDRFHVFFTPNFGSGGSFTQGDYKYNNKPNSVYLWLRDVLGMNQSNRSKEIDDGVVLLLDPDMILLRPLLHNLSGQDVIFASPSRDGSTQPYGNGTWSVEHGKPMAQQDGYLHDEWMKFNVSYVTNGGKFPRFGRHDGSLFWNSGPPYLATVRDMWEMAKLWKDYVPRVYELFPKLFAEMYGLVIATVQLGLPHTLVKSIAVSTTTTQDREGWQFVDELPDDQVCNVDSWADNPKMPIVLHYCQRYFIGKFFFSKYRLKKRFISCETPLLTMPPKNVHLEYDYWVRPPPDLGASHPMEVKKISSAEAKRQAFMLCGLISSMNEAARYFKLHHCEGNGNFSEVYNFHDDPHS